MKVTMPMMSGTASGKLANAVVFFGWKGLAVVRSFVKPVNKMTSGQGDQRIMVGGTGKACGEVLAFEPATSDPTAFAQQLVTLGLIPAGQTKQSYLVKYILNHYLTDATAYGVQIGLYSAHTAYADFETQAGLIGLTEFDLAYANIAPYLKGFGLYLLAKTAIAVGFTGAPYTTALASWTSSEIIAMIADMKAA